MFNKPWDIFTPQGAANANTAVNNAIQEATNNMSDDDRRWFQVYNALQQKSYNDAHSNGPLGVLNYVFTKPSKDLIENVRLANMINDYIRDTDDGKAQWAKLTGQEAETPTTTDTDTTVKEETKTEATTPEEKKETATTADTIEYTYQPGDTFGQVIKNLGLESGSGLWGANGDVEYYTKQLEDQLWNSGTWPAGERQNIPVGTTIRLTRRPVDPALQEYYKKYGYRG